jgi:nicotinamidase-related amidase
MKTAVLLIDLQNDYFPEGKFPLWDTEVTVANILTLIEKAKQRGDLIVHVQHIANPEMGISPFFNKGTSGAEIKSEIAAAAPDAPIVVKEFADSFEQTNLEEILKKNSIDSLLVCGMMTQNCVTHTAISRKAEQYDTAILMDCATTINEMIHKIALHAVSTRVKLTTTAAEYTP